MAVFGIGAFWDGTTDKTGEFIRNNRACVGWDEASAPTLHAIIRQLKIGDLVFIKSFTPQKGLTIKAVGIVRKTDPTAMKDGSICADVEWKWQGEIVLGKVSDKYNVRSITIFEEFNPEVEQVVIDAFLGKRPEGQAL